MKEIDILVIVPHEDDDLITAGPVLYQAIQMKKSVKVVFVTNGDYNGSKEGERRVREAVRALDVLGVEKKDIEFLGYGDQAQAKHLYNGDKEEVLYSHSGNSLTYGVGGGYGRLCAEDVWMSPCVYA